MRRSAAAAAARGPRNVRSTSVESSYIFQSKPGTGISDPPMYRCRLCASRRAIVDHGPFKTGSPCPNQGSTTTVMRRVAGEPHGPTVTTSIPARPGPADERGTGQRWATLSGRGPAVGPQDTLDKDPKQLDGHSVPHATAGGGDSGHVAADDSQLYWEFLCDELDLDQPADIDCSFPPKVPRAGPNGSVMPVRARPRESHSSSGQSWVARKNGYAFAGSIRPTISLREHRDPTTPLGRTRAMSTSPPRSSDSRSTNSITVCSIPATVAIPSLCARRSRPARSKLW
jgi:hypothetical protein